VAITNALPLKAVRRDAISKIKIFWGFEYELQTNPMPFHLDSQWAATLMPLSVCYGLGTEQNKKLRFNSKPFVGPSS